MTTRAGRWMRVALGLAARGIGATGTNPSVGCVIVRDDVVLGRGFTGADGRPHAERQALADAVARAGKTAVAGATAYVTLEPCAHTGKTPPCADALVSHGIARVVAPFADPDTRVSGKGFDALREAGIAVEIGDGATEARAQLRGYLSRKERGRPFLTLKLASTLDGGIATRTGESRWITGAEARARVHLLRARSDAILVGIGSVRADDPALDIRLPGMADRHPRRVVADTRLQTPLTGRLAQSSAERGLILLCSEDADGDRARAFEAIGATVLRLPTNTDGGVEMTAAMPALADLGIGSLLCEGGGRLAASLFRDGLVDELAWFAAGAVLGGGGAPAVADFGVTALKAMPRFERISAEPVGGDIYSVWHPMPVDT